MTLVTGQREALLRQWKLDKSNLEIASRGFKTIEVLFFTPVVIKIFEDPAEANFKLGEALLFGP